MICHHISFLTDEIWLDWRDNILLRIILFSVLAKYNLICRIWTFKIIQDRSLGLADQAFVLDWHRGAWILHWAHHSFGLGEWAGEPVFLTPSILLIKKIIITLISNNFNNQSINCVVVIFESHTKYPKYNRANMSEN